MSTKYILTLSAALSGFLFDRFLTSTSSFLMLLVLLTISAFWSEPSVLMFDFCSKKITVE